MASLLEEILGEKEGALPPEPVKPAETGDFWTDMKNRYNYTAAQAEYAEKKAQASRRPFSEHMKVAEFHRPRTPREQKLLQIMKAIEQAQDDVWTKQNRASSEKSRKFNDENYWRRQNPNAPIEEYRPNFNIEKSIELEEMRAEKARQNLAKLESDWQKKLSEGDITPQAILPEEARYAHGNPQLDRYWRLMTPEQKTMLSKQIEQDFIDKYGWMKPGKKGPKIPEPYQTGSKIKYQKQEFAPSRHLESWIREDNSPQWVGPGLGNRLDKYGPMAPLVEMPTKPQPIQNPEPAIVENAGNVVSLEEFLQRKAIEKKMRGGE